MPTALPAASAFTGSAVTEADEKAALTALNDFLSGLLGTDGVNQTALATLGALLNGILSKSAAYTVVAADRGKMIDCTTGTWTLALTAAATLGGGFAFAVKNSGAGVITFDPNLTEQIDGATTITLGAGESCFVLCDGTGFKTVSKAAALTAAAIVTALGYTPASSTHNHAGIYVSVNNGGYAIGSFASLNYYRFGSPLVSVGSTGASGFLTDSQNSPAAVGGTWVSMSDTNGGFSVFQRIA